MSINIKKSHRGDLHKRLGVPEGQTIPRGKIEADLRHAKKTHNLKDIKQDEFALDAEKFSHRKHQG